MKKEAIIISILIVCLLGLYSLGRGRLGHSIPDEKRYIQSTKEMAESGDYITPRYHGRLRFQKPILFYWLIALSYKLLGVGIFGARFPSIIAALLNVILIYLLGRDLFGKKAGIFSALILSTTEIYFMYARFATPDMTFLLFITASIYLFLKAYRGDIQGRFKYLYMYAFMALAMLTKGPLGFLYPITLACLFLIFKKDWATFKKLNFISGLLVFAVISAPWFIVMIFLHGGEYLNKVWSLEIIKKVKYFSSGTDTNLLIHYFNTALYYAGMVFARHLPWSVFLPASLILIRSLTPVGMKRDYGFTTLKVSRAQDQKSESPTNPVGGTLSSRMGFTFITAWFLAVFASLVLVWSKESYYVLSLSMPLSLFMGAYFSKVTEENNLYKSILFRLPFILAIVAGFLALFLWLGFIVYILDKPILSFSLLMLIAPVLMVWACVGKNRILLPLSFFVAVALYFAYFAGYIMPTVDEESLLRVSEEIREVIRPGDVVGVASSEVSYHRLNVPLRDHIVIRADKRTINRDKELASKGDYINEFLSTKDTRIFCAITMGDYHEFVDEKLRNKLYIIETTFIWRRFHKQDKEYFKRLVSYFRKGERGPLRQALKEEIYIVSNQGNN